MSADHSEMINGTIDAKKIINKWLFRGSFSILLTQSLILLGTDRINSQYYIVFHQG